ncbi:MAG: YceI family protein [Chromatiales bacterium]|nr:YceI family protein [Chromatiales bacterium]
MIDDRQPAAVMRRVPWVRMGAAALALVLTALTALTARAEPARYTVDPEHFVVAFLVDHIGYARTLGLFREASGSFTFDESTATLSDMRIVVRTASVFTNHDKRDRHLRSGDFLDSEAHPEMTFTAATARRVGEREYAVEGTLALRGETRPLTLRATWNKSAEYPIPSGMLGGKPYVMGVSARGSFRRSEFGMTYAVGNGWVGDEVELIIELEARRE